MKPYLEALDPKAVVLGDLAFPLSDTMITPYARNDARVITIEHFSIFNLRYDVENAISIVEMCGVLHNLSVIWHDIMPRDMMEHIVEPGRPVVQPQDPILADDVVLDYEQDRVPRARRYVEGKVTEKV